MIFLIWRCSKFWAPSVDRVQIANVRNRFSSNAFCWMGQKFSQFVLAGTPKAVTPEKVWMSFSTPFLLKFRSAGFTHRHFIYGFKILFRCLRCGFYHHKSDDSLSADILGKQCWSLFKVRCDARFSRRRVLLWNALFDGFPTPEEEKMALPWWFDCSWSRPDMVWSQEKNGPGKFFSSNFQLLLSFLRWWVIIILMTSLSLLMTIKNDKKSHQQPCMIVFVSKNCAPLDMTNGPKNTTWNQEKYVELAKKVAQEKQQAAAEQEAEMRRREELEEQDRLYAQKLQNDFEAAERQTIQAIPANPGPMAEEEVLWLFMTHYYVIIANCYTKCNSFQFRNAEKSCRTSNSEYWSR